MSTVAERRLGPIQQQRTLGDADAVRAWVRELTNALESGDLDRASEQAGSIIRVTQHIKDTVDAATVRRAVRRP